MNIPFVDLYHQYLSIKDEIDDSIQAVIRKSAYIRSSFVSEFERQFAEALGILRVVSCGNGTDALYIALKAMQIMPGDEVITTAHSWISTSETISQASGAVVFCDTDDNFLIDPCALERLITDKTVGIIPVHLYGQAADMDLIMKIAKKHNLWVIEDCAQAHFAKYKDRNVGTIGDIGTFSFYPGKNLGAMGDAGCIVTANDQLANWMELYARHGGKGIHSIEGINSRMDGIQAAILSAKLPKIKIWNEARKRIANTYNHAFSELEYIRTPQIGSGGDHVYHLYVIRTKFRDELKLYLEGKGIETSINYPRALPFYPAYGYKKHEIYDFPKAYSNQFEILSLPMFPEMTEMEVQYICESVLSFFEK